jgi:radical SAM/Cys-rich protein
VDAPEINPPFRQRLKDPLRAQGIDTLQINLGYRCNLECRHCHVEAGPERPEAMSRQVMGHCLAVLTSGRISTVDITGGSPEMHPDFRWFLGECVHRAGRVLVRTNGLLLLEWPYEDLLEFYARNRVEVVLSLPQADAGATNRQRGGGVFPKLIEAIRRLNAKGYGREGTGLVLDLVHNPTGAYLPGPQAGLESHYRKVLRERFGLTFNRLFSITNMPIGRYLEHLQKTDNYEEYMAALVKAFNPRSLDHVMCKSMLSVGWNGTLYDCDFNQMLGLTVNHGAPGHIGVFDFDRLADRKIVVGDHCYGCTAGAGSSCQGQVA